MVKNLPALQEIWGPSLGLVRSPWRRKWQPTPVFSPGKSHGQRSLLGYTPWGRKELDVTERLSTARQHILHLERPCSKLGHNHKSWVGVSFGGHHSVHYKRSHGIHWASKQAGTSHLILCDQHMVLASGSLKLNYLSLTWCLCQPKQSFFILYCVVWSYPDKAIALIRKTQFWASLVVQW